MKEKTVPAVTAAVSTATHLRALPDPPLSALEKLFREHYDGIFRAAYRVTGSASDAEDVLQTLFLRLARRSGPYDFSPNTKSYLLRAAVNASLDLLRSRRRAQTVGIEEVPAENLVAHAHLNPEAQHASRETRKLVQQALAQLGKTAATMFVLRYFEEYDNREIAQMLGTSQMVVAVTLHRARSRMRKELGQFLER